MRLLISGGGTGGHVYPALTVAAAVQTLAAGKPARTDQLYVGRPDSIEERLARRAQIPFQSIQVGGVRGKTPWSAAVNLWHLFAGVGRARGMIRSFKPTAIFATGGYVSAPVIWAGAAERVPSVIYLPDLEPGWAIRASARWATKVAVSFDEVQSHFARGRSVVTGYPVRPEFYQVDRTSARRQFHLDPDARTVTIFGGSTGAHHINQVAADHLADLAGMAQVVCITGRNDEAWMNDQVQRLSPGLSARVRVFGYLDEELAAALAAADVVVARAGAATLGEFPALGLPAILVPYPYAGRHQDRNAQFLVARGAAAKIDDARLSQELVSAVKRFFDEPEKAKNMSAAARALAQPQAATRMAALLESLEAHP